MNKQTKYNISKSDLEKCLEFGMSQKQMAEKFNCSVDTIRARFKEYNLQFLGSRFFNTGRTNPACRLEVRNKIARTVKTLWEDGFYDNRINGITDKTGFNHHNYKGEKWNYRDYLNKYQDITVCAECGKTINESKIDVHHIDENHDNWLVTNLVPLCVNCHQKKHLHTTKQPVVTISYKGHFDSSHNLLWYNGACERLHGHRYFYEVEITNQINSESGMVMDFKELKKLLKEHIEDPLDHFYLNNVLPFNTTAENMVVWIFEVLSKRALIKGITKVSLWETPDCRVQFTSKNMLDYFMSNHTVDTLDNGQLINQDEEGK